MVGKRKLTCGKVQLLSRLEPLPLLLTFKLLLHQGLLLVSFLFSLDFGLCNNILKFDGFLTLEMI